MHPRHARALTGVFVIAAGMSASAIFARPDIEYVPADRIIANLERQVAANPKDAALQARLARAHMLAYAQDADLPAPRGTLEIYTEPGAPPAPPAIPGPGATDVSRRQHLEQATAHYREAVTLAPDDVLARLGYAWTLDQSGKRADAIAEYRTVIERAWMKEKDKRFLPPGDRSIAVEAGTYLERLLDVTKDQAEIDAIHARAQQVARLPRAITPIAIPLRDGVTIDRLLDVTAAVGFDADGSGLDRSWTWIARDAAWLVFDPRRTGRITSALQLFGSVTFWMFWSDGYEPLAALDDDGDGALRGTELTGLALWNDRNGNGVSDRGEVRPVEDHGIVAIACRAERTPHDPWIAAFARDGVTFADGSRRASYDVILRTAAALTH